MAVIAGGNKIAGKGGYLECWNWTGITGATGSQPKPINLTRLDVVRWEMFDKGTCPPMWGSGSFGATRRRKVITDWHVQARVWWAYDNAPELAFTQGDGMALRLKIGADAAWIGDGIEPGILTGTGLTFISYYIAPLGVWTNQHPICPSEGDEDGIVYEDFSIEGDSLMWYIADQTAEDLFYAYVALLATQGEIPNNMPS